MGYASISGRAVTDPDSPSAFAVCDRCQRWFNHVDLRWQFDYRGRNLQNIRILVCETCEDEPQPQLKPRIIPPDPVSIANARVEQFCQSVEDYRTSSNPALPNIDYASTINVTLSGYQFIDGIQTTEGELILVIGQTDVTKNGIYKVSSGLWRLQAFSNERKVYYDALEAGLTRYGQLGYYLGAVNVSRGPAFYGKLFQIYMEDPNHTFAEGTNVYAGLVNPSTVNHYDFYTGIYTAGGEVLITQNSEIRTTQQVGQAASNTNEIPGFNQIIPGACDVGDFNEVPYGCGNHRSLPSSTVTLPFAGPLWPTLQNQSVNVWLNGLSQPLVWANESNVQLTFNNFFWQGPGAAWNPISYDVPLSQWVFGPGGNSLWTASKCDITLWHNFSGTNVNWAQIYPNAVPPNKTKPWPYGWS